MKYLFTITALLLLLVSCHTTKHIQKPIKSNYTTKFDSSYKWMTSEGWLTLENPIVHGVDSLGFLSSGTTYGDSSFPLYFSTEVLQNKPMTTRVYDINSKVIAEVDTCGDLKVYTDTTTVLKTILRTCNIKVN